MDLSFKIRKDLPSRRGCRTASERRLTTVSRPFTSADTAYMVVSLHSKINDASTAVFAYSPMQESSHMEGTNAQTLHFITLRKVFCWEATHLDVWQSHIPPCFSNVRRISSLLPYWAVDYRYKNYSITSRACLTFHFVVFTSLFYLQKRRVSLRSVRSHSGTLLHVWIPNLLKLKIKKKKKTNMSFTSARSWRKVDIIICISAVKHTSNCAELTKLVLGSDSEAIF